VPAGEAISRFGAQAELRNHVAARARQCRPAAEVAERSVPAGQGGRSGPGAPFTVTSIPTPEAGNQIEANAERSQGYTVPYHWKCQGGRSGPGAPCTVTPIPTLTPRGATLTPAPLSAGAAAGALVGAVQGLPARPPPLTASRPTMAVSRGTQTQASNDSNSLEFHTLEFQTRFKLSRRFERSREFESTLWVGDDDIHTGTTKDTASWPYPSPYPSPKDTARLCELAVSFAAAAGDREPAGHGRIAKDTAIQTL
jgi:hypothetical protein